MADVVTNGNASPSTELAPPQDGPQSVPVPRAGFWSVFSTPDLAFLALRDTPEWFWKTLVAGLFLAAAQSFAIYRIGVQQLLANVVRGSAAIDAAGTIRNLPANSWGLVLGQVLAACAGSFVMALLLSAVLWLSIMIVSERVPFRRILAAVALAVFFYSVLRGTMLIATIIVAKHPEAINMKEPLATSLAYFIHSSSRAWHPVLVGLDVLSLASGVLLVRGLSVITGVAVLECAISVGVPWLAYVLRGLAVSLF